MNRSSITPKSDGTNVASGDSISIDLRRQDLVVEGGQLLSHCTIVNNDLVTQAPSLDACERASGAEKKSSPSSSSTLISSSMKSSDLNFDRKQMSSSSVSVEVPESVPITATANDATTTDAEASSDSQAKPQKHLTKTNEPQDKDLNLTLDDDGSTTTIDHIETTGQLQLHPPPRPNSSSNRYTANHGRDMHHLSIALDILGDLDYYDDTTDPDDDVEDDEAEALRISLPQ